jgi:ribosomal protein S18 acetylase RimI-like enzyme
MTASIDALQAYLRRVAALQYETVPLPGLTLYFHPSDDLIFFNYAIPDPGWAGAGPPGALDVSLARMRAECAARRRRPRFEFIHEAAPGLDAALRAAGFVEQARQSLMVCTAATVRAAPPVPGLHIQEWDGAAPLDALQAVLTVQRRGFDPGDAGSATPDEARHLARTLGGGRAFLARLDGQAAAAGIYSAPLEAGPQGTRFAEIAGLATLAPFRRRGIATALAARAAQSALDRGVDVVCLVAEDERAGRVYERVGFRARATRLAYVAG